MKDRRNGGTRAAGEAPTRPGWLQAVDLAAAVAIVLLATPARPQAGAAPAAPPNARTGTGAAHGPDG